MPVTTVGKLLLKRNLPDPLKPEAEKPLDGKALGKLFQKIGDTAPDDYGKHVSSLTRLGFEISTRQGSSLSLKDLTPSIDKKKMFDEAEKKVEAIKAKKLPRLTENEEIQKVYDELAKNMEKELMDRGLAENHTLAKIILAGARGSPAQYRQTVGAQILATDSKGQPITDFPIKSSFAEGLTVPEYLVSSFSARQGLVATKVAVADAGFLSKQLSRAAMTTKVEMVDCNTPNGIPVSTTDTESIGALLAKPVGGYNRNNEVTSAMLLDLQKKGISEIIVRSPITCQAAKDSHSGAVCQYCVGKRERNRFAPIGDFIGVTAATTLGEPLSQGTLNSKHGTGAKAARNLPTGFKLINQLTNIPETFRGKAPVVEKDGVVKEIRKAPQGGHYIVIEE
jgi:DNA-directed RNA polymerase subunit beta'